MKCTGYLMKNHNEIPRDTFEKPQWNALGIKWKIAMKCTGYIMKNHNEMHWASNEKSQWNALGI